VSDVRFNFRLQKVLELRERGEQVAAARVAAAAERAQSARDAHEALAAVRAAGAEEIQRAHAHAPTVGQLSNLAFLLDRLDAHVDASASDLRAADQVVEKAQDELTVAFQARRVIDRLKERQQEEWRIDVTQADQRTMDELALARYTQRVSGETESEK
jgi:flagellar protein FliJ